MILSAEAVISTSRVACQNMRHLLLSDYLSLLLFKMRIRFFLESDVDSVRIPVGRVLIAKTTLLILRQRKKVVSIPQVLLLILMSYVEKIGNGTDLSSDCGSESNGISSQIVQSHLEEAGSIFISHAFTGTVVSGNGDQVTYPSGTIL